MFLKKNLEPGKWVITDENKNYGSCPWVYQVSYDEASHSSNKITSHTFSGGKGDIVVVIITSSWREKTNLSTNSPTDNLASSFENDLNYNQLQKDITQYN